MKKDASNPASVRIATNVGKFLDTAAPMANRRKIKMARLYACLRPIIYIRVRERQIRSQQPWHMVVRMNKISGTKKKDKNKPCSEVPR